MAIPLRTHDRASAGSLAQTPPSDRRAAETAGPLAALLARAAERAGRRDAGLLARMRGELAHGFRRLEGLGPAVSIWGSARTSPEHPDYQLARELAERVGRAGFAVITGGGPGMMEAANLGARRVGATSVGLRIQLPWEDVDNPFLDVPITFNYLFARKVMFVRYSSAFIVMPGGFGTLDELFELLTLLKNRKIDTVPVLLYGSSYWGGLLDWLQDTMLAAGNISAAQLDLLALVDDPDTVVAVAASAAARAAARD